LEDILKLHAEMSFWYILPSK